MIVSIIVAMDQSGGIGLANRLPWHLPADLKRFKKLTMGHHLVMGRKTYESIGKPLPGRTMIVISRNPDYSAAGCLVAHSLGEALEIARSNGEDELFVIGGREIFTQALPIADRIYLTRVEAIVEADVFFPPYDPVLWKQISSEWHGADDQNAYAYRDILLVRAT